MCGRFSLEATWDELRAWYDLLGPAANLEARYNIAPTQMAPVLTREAGAMRLRPMRWGLVPSWVTDRGKFPTLINARAETAAVKPSFRAALAAQRCLIPASGYYEWTAQDGVKTPHYITLKAGGVMMFAGLWEHWQPPAEAEMAEIFSFAVLTTSASPALANIHHRMPVILTRDAGLDWLSPGGEALLSAPPQPMLANWPVSSQVNAVHNQGAALIQPVERTQSRGGPRHDPQPDLFG